MKKLLCVLMALCMMLGLTATLASAQAGPSEDQWDEGSYYAYVSFVRVNGEGEVVFSEDYQAYYAFQDNQPKGELAGAVYDRDTNTLTITNLDKPDFLLEINAMGDDFKINVVGECSLSRISVWGWGWGAGLTITGDGHLTLNESKTGFYAISSSPEGAPAPKIEFGADVTVDMYSSGSVMSVIYSDSDNSPFVFGSEPAEEVRLEKQQATDIVSQTVNVYMGEQITRSFLKVNRASDPDGVYGALQTTWYKDYEAGIIDYEGYTVYKLVYAASIDAWVFDPSFGAEFDDYPTEADLSTEEFEAEGFSVVTDEYGYEIWSDYTIPGEYFSSMMYTDGTNNYFCYFRWDDELEESVRTYYHIIPVEGLEETYLAGDPAEGVKEEDVYPAGEEITLDGIYNYIVKNSELHVGPGGTPPFPFKDVKDGKWYTEPIKYVYYHGLMNGMTDTTFEPNSNMSRAMLVTVLWRAEGSPAPKGTTPFTDLKAKWYKDAVAWAYENKIVNGMSDTTFAPNNSITREQIAAIFYRFADFKGEDVTGREDISKFPDGSKVSKYAKEAMSWAVAEGLISGTKVDGKDYLDPKGNATRAQVATILMRYLTNFDKPSGTVHGVSTDNTVTLGWMINALYELEGKPEVTDWSPFDEISDMAIYDPDKTAEWNFWTTTVKEEWYYKPLMWAIEHKLYVPFKYSTVIGDFSNSSVYKWEVIDLIAKYCEKFGIELPKVRDYPGFDDLDELENSDPNIIKVYESGLISESESGKLGLYDGEFTLDEAESIIEKITALRNGN